MAEGHLKPEEERKLRSVFFDVIIDVLDDYDPSGIIGETIKLDSGIARVTYLNNKTEDFIQRLKE